MLETLEKVGFEISRATISSISIKNPDPKGRNIRLKGALYEQDFRFGEDLRADITHRSRQHRATNESRLRDVTEKYQRGIEAKRAENNRRYKRPAVTHEQGSIQALSVELARYIGGRVDSHSRAVHSDMERQERAGRLETAESRSRAHPRPVGNQDQRFDTGKLPSREQQSNAGMRSDREANDESLNALGRKVGRARAGKHEFSAAASELGSRVRAAERNTATAERNLESTSQTISQRHKRTQSRGWGMSR
ncbi:B protein (plasmid) [Neisseria gonorrhoeae DGI2]|nr:B protein [Neisseria gonorrhoeae DGI2]